MLESAEGRRDEDRGDASQRAEYRSPNLRRWGTLKELTLGSLGGSDDAYTGGTSVNQ